MLSGRGLPLLSDKGKARFTCWKLKPGAFVLDHKTAKLFQQVITQTQDVVGFCCSKPSMTARLSARWTTTHPEVTDWIQRLLYCAHRNTLAS